MLTFRADDEQAAALRRWAERLGVDRSSLLREALRRHLVGLAAEDDVAAWERDPLTDDEAALSEVADWKPAEDWSDWIDAER